MTTLKAEAALFSAQRIEDVELAAQRVAFRLACGFDPPENGSDRLTLTAAIGRARRALAKERVRAARAHWSYDLNRHIGLKMAYDRLLRMLDPELYQATQDKRHHEKQKRRPRAPSHASGQHLTTG